MPSIRFALNKRPNGTCHINAFFQNGAGVQPSKYTGYSIPATKIGKGQYKYWNSTRQRVRSLDPAEMDEINKKLDAWEGAFRNYISQCAVNEVPADIPEFIAKLTGGIKSVSQLAARNKKEPTLVSIAEEFIRSIGITHAKGTQNNYEVLLGNLTEYDEKRGRPVKISEVDSAFYKDFATYLITEQGNVNSTVKKKHANLAKIMSFASEDLKLAVPARGKKLKLKTGKSPKEALDVAELKVLRAFACNTEYQQMVLDAFLLACETGLRYSDICQLQMVHVQTRVTPKGMKNILDLTSIKGSKENNMVLSTHALTILAKYEQSEGALFKFRASQSASKTLKTIFKHKDVKLERLCEVVTMKGAETTRETKKLCDIVSFHCGRKTYITRLARAGLPLSYVKDNAGHSDLRVTQGYYQDSDVERWHETEAVLNGE